MSHHQLLCTVHADTQLSGVPHAQWVGGGGGPALCEKQNISGTDE